MMAYRTHTVTPDVFRGPPCRTGKAGGESDFVAARWTPEHVRGDGDFVVSGVISGAKRV